MVLLVVLLIASAATATPHIPGPHTTYLPHIASPGEPDLVGRINLSPERFIFIAGEPVRIDVTIANIGVGSSPPVWADLYINPNPVPSEPNRPWYETCSLTPCFGLVWAVPALLPGESITLSSTPESLSTEYSVWPGWFAAGTSDLYLYIDSWKPGSAVGATSERNERNNRAQLRGLRVTGTNPPITAAPAAARR